MPRELVAIAPRTPVLREYEEPPLKSHQVRIKSEFSAPKHGTELGLYRGTSPFSVRRWDPQYNMFFPREETEHPGFPMPLGNTTVGVIVEVGSEVTQYKVGDRVFGHFPIRETHTVDARHIEGIVPEGMSPQAIVYWDPAEFALGAIRDGQVRLGERVVVFGLGAIGLMIVQMAKLSGAVFVVAVDPIEKRRAAALKHGADVVLDPFLEDVGLKIKELTDKVGPDVVFEVSGSYTALHEAIRCCGMRGRIVPVAFYQGEARGLRLGEEWHMNAVTIISSRANTEPNREYPLWNNQRIRQVAFDLLKTGRLQVDDLVDPIVPFDQSAEAYRMIDEHPERCIKLGVVY